jgi:hypothetical protein
MRRNFAAPIKKGPAGAASKFPAATRACAEGSVLGVIFTPKKRTVVPTWSSRRGTTTIPGVTRTLPAANFSPTDSLSSVRLFPQHARVRPSTRGTLRRRRHEGLSCFVVSRSRVSKVLAATITPTLAFEVSPRIKQEFENGRQYYALHGQPITLPQLAECRPERCPAVARRAASSGIPSRPTFLSRLCMSVRAPSSSAGAGSATTHTRRMAKR